MRKGINVLNLYACLGGNRYKWDEAGKTIFETAIGVLSKSKTNQAKLF